MTALPVVGHHIGSGALPPPKPGLVVVRVDGETVLYDPEADLLHYLDRTASAVWSQLDGTVTLQALAGRVAATFGASEKAVRRDVRDLMALLWGRGLLRGSQPGPTADLRRPAEHGLEAGRPDTASELELPAQPLPDANHRTGRYRALEHAFEVATNDAAVRDYCAAILIDLAAPAAADPQRYELLDLGAGPGGPHYVVLFGGTPVITTDALDQAIAVLLWHINAEAVRRSTPLYAVLHAAAAVSRGVAVLLPAPSESGKTTTVAGLVRAGFGYLTDEAVAIDPGTLLAHPYAKALSIHHGSWDVLADLQPAHRGRLAGQWQLPARLIRPDAVAGPAPVGFVVTPVYDPSAATRLEPISPGEMLMQLADSTFKFQNNAPRNLSVLAQIAATAGCYRLSVNDLNEAVGLIDDLVASEELDVAKGEPPVAKRGH